MVTHEGDQGLHEGRDRSLHVGRASAIEHPVFDGRHKGWGRPVRERSRRDHIGVSEKDDQRRGIAVARPEIGHIAEHERFRVEARC